MSEITSSIRIEDGFTEPLKNLAKASWDVESGISAVAKSLVDQAKEIDDISGKAKELGISFAKNIGSAAKDNVGLLKEAFIELFKFTNEGFKNFGKDISKFGSNSFWGGFFSMFKRWDIVNKTSMAAFHKLKDSYIRGFTALRDSLEKSMDEINLSDKFNSMFGEAGDVARKRAYELANELGENATMVSELSAKAAYEGIGTEHFEQMMKLADKVSKLKTGESVESVAGNLISNIKSGHDASSIAQMFGGGQQMERQLINAGYERALNRGDIGKALEIAEKIAEQAGLTDEKYQAATDNLSNNYKKIMNNLDNVQRRLAESFNRAFAPTVKKIKELVESQKFKTIVNIADYLISKLGKFLNWFAEGAVDNIGIIGVMLGVGIVSKVMFLLPKIKLAIKILALSKGPLGFIIRQLTTITGKIVGIIAKQGIAALKTKALAALKVAGPWVAAAAAVAGVTYGIYKLTGTTKSFTGWLKGILGAAMQGGMNVFTNIFIFFDRLGTKIKMFAKMVKAGTITMIGMIKSKFGELLGWIIEKLIGFVSNNPVLSKIMEALDVDLSSVAQSAKEWTGSFGENEMSAANKIYAEIQQMEANQQEYIDVTQGVQEAYESEGATVINHLKELIGLNKEQVEKQKSIDDDTGKIRKMGEQEEELRWMKAFSDRQIMSSYNSMTSNSRTINLNGVSQNTMAEAYRRNRSTIPSRASL